MEPLFGRWQGRLPQELRLHGISTDEGANVYLPPHLRAWHTQPLTMAAAAPGRACVPCRRPELPREVALQHTPTVAADNPVQVNRTVFQLQCSPLWVSFPKCRVTVYEQLDGSINIGFGPHTLGRSHASGQLLPHHHRTEHVFQKADLLPC